MQRDYRSLERTEARARLLQVQKDSVVIKDAASQTRMAKHRINEINDATLSGSGIMIRPESVNGRLQKIATRRKRAISCCVSKTGEGMRPRFFKTRRPMSADKIKQHADQT
jgi:hypothetical protein